MDSGKLRQNDTAVVDLQPTTHFELVFMRRREFLPHADPFIATASTRALRDEGPPIHERSKRWHSQDAFEMRRITKLLSKAGDLIGYRPMIQHGHGLDRERPNKSFRASDFGGSMEEALRQAKIWRDSMETKLGIKPGTLRSGTIARPWSGISLIVAKSAGARAYWGSNRQIGSKGLRAYIGKRSYIDAYHDLIHRIAERDGIPLPRELPSPPPPRADQYLRMTEAGLTGIPKPSRRRKKVEAV